MRREAAADGDQGRLQVPARAHALPRRRRAPGIGFASTLLTAHIADGYGTLLLGLNVFREPYQPGAVSIIASSTVVARCFVAEGRPGEGCIAQWGGSAGLHISVANGWALVPEISTLRPLAGPVDVFGAMAGPWLQGGIGLQFRKPERSRPASED